MHCGKLLIDTDWTTGNASELDSKATDLQDHNIPRINTQR